MIAYVSTMVFCLISNPNDCQTVQGGVSFPLERCEMHGKMWAEGWLKAHPDYELKGASCDPKEQ